MDVYIAHTPYHLILTILSGFFDRPCTVILMDMQGTLNWYKGEYVTKYFNNRYRYLDFGDRSLKKKVFDKSRCLRILGREGSIQSLIEYLAVVQPSRFIVFNDAFPEVQNILEAYKFIPATYLEDGSAPYNSHKVKHRTPAFLQRVLFGRYYDRISVLGTSHYVKDSLLRYPHLARRENRLKPVTELSFNTSRLNKFSEFCELYDLGNIPQLSSGSFHLYLLPPSADQLLLRVYSELIKRDVKAGIRPLIKAHPVFRPQSGLLQECEWVNSYIPTEVLLGRMRQIIALKSYMSTSLMTTRSLYQDVDVYCVVPQSQREDVRFTKNIESMGVRFIRYDDVTGRPISA